MASKQTNAIWEMLNSAAVRATAAAAARSVGRRARLSGMTRVISDCPRSSQMILA